MRVVGVRRYPVKSCRGEWLESVAVDERGLVGDRGWAVVDEDGKLASGKDSRRFRRMDPVFDLAAVMGSEPVPAVLFPGESEPVPVDRPGADQRLAAHMGRSVAFRPEGPDGTVSHMDAGRVSLVGTASLAALPEVVDLADPAGPGSLADPRRFRVNLVVETDTPWAEEGWLGREVRIGSVVLRPVSRIPRCRMVDIAQDGVDEQPGLLRALGAARGPDLAVYADVAVPGRISVGDAVLV